MSFVEGDRVLVHEPSPPYDPVGGTVVAVQRLPGGAARYDIQLDVGHVVYPDAQRLHRWPLPADEQCMWCGRRLRIAGEEYPT
jgi:hypothetical protein